MQVPRTRSRPARTCTRSSTCRGTHPIEEVRHAYRRLARTRHPDARGEAGADRFRRITAAYEVLGHVDRRASYDRDRRLRERRSGPAGPGPSSRRGLRRGPARPLRVQRPTHARTAARTGGLWPVDDWGLVRILGRVVLAAAVVVCLFIGMLVAVAAARDPEPLPAPTIFCRTPDGWSTAGERPSPACRDLRARLRSVRLLATASDGVASRP